MDPSSRITQIAWIWRTFSQRTSVMHRAKNRKYRASDCIHIACSRIVHSACPFGVALARCITRNGLTHSRRVRQMAQPLCTEDTPPRTRVHSKLRRAIDASSRDAVCAIVEVSAENFRSVSPQLHFLYFFREIYTPSSYCDM